MRPLVSQCIFALLVFSLYYEASVFSVEVRLKACQRSGGEYCSSGKTEGYIGLLDTADQLKEALRRTAYKKEIIVSAESRLSDAGQNVARFVGMAGYGHLLTILDSVDECHTLAHVMAPWQQERGNISCGAYTAKNATGHPYPHHLKYFAASLVGIPSWWAKWFTVARAVALGYNVLAVDSDVLVLDDWYWRAKQPPLNAYQMMSQAESERAINGGFTYVQNASPTGPVAWLLYEAMFRLVRWAEDHSVLAKASQYIAETGFLEVDDQIMLTDTMLSCAVGRPTFLSLSFLFRFKGREAAYHSVGLRHEGELRETIMKRASDWQFKTYKVSGALAPYVCDKRVTGPCELGPDGVATTRIQTTLLKMPHSDGEWPLGVGGYPFNPNLGPLARAYKQAFYDLGVPLPPDPESMWAQKAARTTPSELFALLNIERDNELTGSWAESHWWGTGRHGYWHLHLWPPPPAPQPAQGMGHIFAGIYPGSFQKITLLQLNGHYDWRVAARLTGGQFRVFHTLSDYHHKQHHDRAPEIRLVLSYSPGVIPDDLDKKDFVLAAQGLAQLGVALGAVVAWPGAPCWANWTQAKTGPDGSRLLPAPSRRHRLPWTYLDTRYTVQPFGDSLEDLQCEWVGFSDVDCIKPKRDSPTATPGGRGLLAVEFHHLRHMLGPLKPAMDADGGGSAGGSGGGVEAGQAPRFAHRSRLLPSPATTLRLSKDADATRSKNVLHNVLYDDVVQLNVETMSHAVRGETVSVLWVDRVVGEVQGLSEEAAQAYGEWASRCRALKYFDLPEHVHSDW